MSDLNEIVAAVLLVVGTLFTVIGSVGLVRLPDFYTRMHAPTKATTVGVSSILAAAALLLPGNGLALAAKAALVIVFLFLTAPIGAHMMARAARHGGIRPAPETYDELPPAPIERLGEGPAGR